MNILFFQTADAFRYQPMLSATSRTIIEYCRRSNCLYESFTGLKRGFWPWQATFNRILMFDDLLYRGFCGWAVYLDADAYIVDLDFDLRQYLSDISDCAAILIPSGTTDQLWDVNAGVCLINTDHVIGRRLIGEWVSRFRSVSDETLRQAETWMETDNDQDFLQRILRDQSEIMKSVYLQSPDLMNSSYAAFIRQHLRQYTPDFEKRIGLINKNVNAIMGDTSQHHPGDLSNGQDVADRLANEAIGAVYRGLLKREPDPDGGRNALAGMQVRGFADGLCDLASGIATSAEFEALRRRP